MREPRVLLIDDDEFIVRFVQMALEDQPLVLTYCHRLDEARRQVRDTRFNLLICDQMLPDGLGLDFLAALRASAFMGATPPDVPTLMFSAGILDDQRQRALALGVCGVLRKPVSIAELLSAVRQALRLESSGAEAATAKDWVGASAAQDLELANRHFAGNLSLYRAFVQTVRQQAALDLDRGDRAVAAKAWPDLRRLAHSLKTVFPMVGDDPAGALARELEQAASRGLSESEHLWRAVREHLQRVAITP